MSKQAKRVALLTGGSSGIGLSTVRMLIGRNWTVYTMSRRPCPVAEARFVQGDVNDETSVRLVIQTVIAEQGQLDALICCAGNGLAGAVEDCTSDEVAYQFQTTWFGLDKTIRACLPTMRKQGGGTIITISSVAAVVPIPFQTYYSAAKAAILHYTKALSLEVRAWNIRCSCILPGDTKTGFTAARRYAVASQSDESAYGVKMKDSVGRMERDEQNGMSPDKIARAICRQLDKRHPAISVVPGWNYKLFALLVRILPNRFVLRVVGMLY